MFVGFYQSFSVVSMSLPGLLLISTSSPGFPLVSQNFTGFSDFLRFSSSFVSFPRAFTGFLCCCVLFCLSVFGAFHKDFTHEK